MAIRVKNEDKEIARRSFKYTEKTVDEVRDELLF
jgi:hypothetical protein